MFGVMVVVGRGASPGTTFQSACFPISVRGWVGEGGGVGGRLRGVSIG